MPNIANRTYPSDKPILDAIKRDKRKVAKEKAQHERDMKKAAKTVVTGR